MKIIVICFVMLALLQSFLLSAHLVGIEGEDEIQIEKRNHIMKHSKPLVSDRRFKGEERGK